MDFMIDEMELHKVVPHLVSAERIQAVQSCRLDWRNVSTLEQARHFEFYPWAHDWFATGSNHREEDGKIVRDCPPGQVFIVTFDTTKRLVEFLIYSGMRLGWTDYAEYPVALSVS